MDPMVHLGAWVWSFPVMIAAIALVCGGALYAGADKFSRPSTDRLRREEAERETVALENDAAA